MNFLKPPALDRNDTICIVAPSSPFQRENFDKGIAVLRDLGLKVQFDAKIQTRTDKLSYLAGSDAVRSSELLKALLNPKIKAIFFARGGYGAVRLIPFLKKKLARKKLKPKILAGLSDATTILLAAQKWWSWTTFYAPVIGGGLEQMMNEFSVNSLHDQLFAKRKRGADSFPYLKVIHPGKARGELVGGCLTLLVNSLGTSYEIDTRGKILFFEDTNEKPYHVDRLLMQLKLAGKLKHCRGILIGGLTDAEPLENYFATVHSLTKDLKIPVMMGFPCGHLRETLTLPLGARVELDTKNKQLVYLERGVNA